MLTKNDAFTEVQIAEIDVVKVLIKEKLKSFKFPTEVSKLLRKSILTGGVSASLFHGEKPKDWDIYLTDSNDIKTFEGLIPDLLDMIEDIDERYGGSNLATLQKGKLVTARAVSFKNRVQIITMHNADARKSFDYIHAMPYFDLQRMSYHISRRQYDSIKTKTLVKNPNGQEPASYRTSKFLERGWKIQNDIF